MPMETLTEFVRLASAIAGLASAICRLVSELRAGRKSKKKGR